MEKIMDNERLRRVRKTTRLHLAMEAEETLQRIEDFPDKPGAMQYFYSLFRDTYNGNGTPALPGTKKIIATMCMQVPQELILAAGAYPLRLCSGANAYDQIGAEFMPSKSCPVVKATIGMLHVNQSLWGESLSSIVIPTTCDQKKKAGELLGDMGYSAYNLEMPSSKDSDLARFYWQEAVKQFVLDLQKITGNRITAKKVQGAIAKITDAGGLFRKLYELRRNTTPLILGTDLFLVNNAYFFDDIDSWRPAVAALIKELEERKVKKIRVTNRQAPRILFTGSPPIFPNFKVPILEEQSGGIIVADETCSSTRLLSDSVAYDEVGLNDMVPAIADRYLKPSTCPCLTPNSDRIRKLVNMAREYGADGVIYQALSGCLPYEMEQKLVNQTLTQEGIPMLYIETDYSPEDMGQLSTRVEAFIESIKARNRKKTRPN
jgi:benzoyl-CoA reductase/2-hydroxyglutaryl-CoA dehydratase subunit BcrC/BadD/HgdB